MGIHFGNQGPQIPSEGSNPKKTDSTKNEKVSDSKEKETQNGEPIHVVGGPPPQKEVKETDTTPTNDLSDISEDLTPATMASTLNSLSAEKLQPGAALMADIFSES